MLQRSKTEGLGHDEIAAELHLPGAGSRIFDNDRYSSLGGGMIQF